MASPTLLRRTPPRGMRAASRRVLATTRISRAIPRHATLRETRLKTAINPSRRTDRTPQVTGNPTPTRLRSDPERSRQRVPPALRRRISSRRAIRERLSMIRGSPGTSEIAPSTPNHLAPKTRKTPASRTRLRATPKSRPRIRVAPTPRARQTEKRGRSQRTGMRRALLIAGPARMNKRRTPSRLVRRIPSEKKKRGMRQLRCPTSRRPRPNKRPQETPRMVRKSKRMPEPRHSVRIKLSEGKTIGKLTARIQATSSKDDRGNQEDRRRAEDQGLHQLTGTQESRANEIEESKRTRVDQST